MKWNFKYFLQKIVFVTFFIFGVSVAQTPFTGLVLEQLDNGGVVDGTTYRLYAELSEGILYAIYADENNPSLLQITGSTQGFVNDQTYGGDFQNEINPALFDAFPSVEWDTWITIGDSYDDAALTVGDLHTQGFVGSAWSFGGTENSDASIFRTPDDVLCLPENGLVLLGRISND